MSQKKFHAFISYSHADCGDIAPVIQKAIENIGKPWLKLGRNLDIYRDETNLSATSELWPSIKDAILNSEYFILLASPKSASSYWINKEILTWISQKEILENKNKKILIILVNGEIVWSREKNEFDWEHTTCLPITLSKIYVNEPLWIDLKPYIFHGKNKIDATYKEPGFRAAISKIIGAILDKDPREVESDELNRVRRFRFFISLFLLTLLGTIAAAYTLYFQRNLEKKISLSNTLFAQGNRVQESNVSKALIYYAYGFKSYPTLANFKFLNSFYLSKILCYSNDSSTIDTLNRFNSLMLLKSPYLSIDTNATEFYSRPKARLSFPNNKYYYLTEQGIYLYELISHRADSVLFDGMRVNSQDNMFSNNPNVGYIVFSIPGGDTLVNIFELENRNIKPIIYRNPAKYAGALIYNGKLINSNLRFEVGVDDHLSLSLSQTGRFLAVYDRGNDSPAPLQANFNLIIIDLFKKQLSLKNLKLPKEAEYENVENLAISEDGALCYISFYTGGARGFTDHYIYNIVTESLEKIIYNEHTSYGLNLANQVSSFKWGKEHDYFIYGTGDGRLVVQSTKVYNGQVILIPDEFRHKITAIEISEKYIIAGTDKGVLHFFRNELKNNPFDEFYQRMGFDYIISLQLPHQKEIASLSYDIIRKCLFIEDIENRFDQLNFSRFEHLRNDESTIVNDLIRSGIEDLSAGEKLQFGIK